MKSQLTQFYCKRSILIWIYVNSILFSYIIDDESNRLFKEIERHSYDFNVNQKSIDVLSKIIDHNDSLYYDQSRNKIINYFNKIFFDEVKIIKIKNLSSQHKEECKLESELINESLKVNLLLSIIF